MEPQTKTNKTALYIVIFVIVLGALWYFFFGDKIFKSGTPNETDMNLSNAGKTEVMDGEALKKSTSAPGGSTGYVDPKVLQSVTARE